MSLILNIDTTAETAFVNLAEKGTVLFSETNSVAKEHASFLHVAIKLVLEKANKKINEVDAIAVVAGPGSYTGIRVGLAAAKGICFALNKPLITVNALEILALNAIDSFNDLNAYYCPMIDARRMEVFTAIYESSIEIVLQPAAIILQSSSFDNLLVDKKIYFFGNGSTKWMEICSHANANFNYPKPNTEATLAKTSYTKFIEKKIR